MTCRAVLSWAVSDHAGPYYRNCNAKTVKWNWIALHKNTHSFACSAAADLVDVHQMLLLHTKHTYTEKMIVMLILCCCFYWWCIHLVLMFSRWCSADANSMCDLIFGPFLSLVRVGMSHRFNLYIPAQSEVEQSTCWSNFQWASFKLKCFPFLSTSNEMYIISVCVYANFGSFFYFIGHSPAERKTDLAFGVYCHCFCFSEVKRILRIYHNVLYVWERTIRWTHLLITRKSLQTFLAIKTLNHLFTHSLTLQHVLLLAR